MEQQISLALGIILGIGTAALLAFLFTGIRKSYPTHQREITSLLEVGVLFLPAVPAYLWVWPNLKGTSLDVFQIVVYVYVLAGTIFIAWRNHYSWNALGINRTGVQIGLAYGALLVAGRSLVILAADWNAPLPPINGLTALGDLAYCILIGITEELLFRGLVYRVLLNWRGTRWAIWGSTAGFMLWHIFGQGPLVGMAMLLYGLIFALMRWRTGGITALVITHALVDFLAFQMLPDIDVVGLGRPEVPHPAWLLTGLFLIIVIPLFLWLGHSRIFKNSPQ